MNPRHRPPNRRELDTIKIGRAVTGFHGAIFVHAEHLDGKIVSVRFSHKWKDVGPLDLALAALGDAVTSIAREIQREGAG